MSQGQIDARWLIAHGSPLMHTRVPQQKFMGFTIIPAKLGLLVDESTMTRTYVKSRDVPI